MYPEMDVTDYQIDALSPGHLAADPAADLRPVVHTIHSGDRVSGRGTMIPQSKFRPLNRDVADHGDRAIDSSLRHEPVYFNSTNSDVGIGIALSDALAGKYERLEGRDDRLFMQCGPSISVRISWAGCYPPWARQIPTRDFKNSSGPVTRSKVAKNVACSMQRFIDEMNCRALEEDADPSWAVGRARNGIVLEDLAFVKLEHVSRGNWLVYLCLASPSIEKGPDYGGHA
ncbi:unnamed protein product [Peniophora sp. CBMAI 1063]|nr:unnamed protein product [Peniophora sp. CBMAI 1063]